MPRQFSHKEVVEIAYRWVMANASCGVAFKELVSVNREIPDVIGFGSWNHSVVIEVKVSRSDFLCDKKKPFRKEPETGMGTRRYYCCPSGLIKRDELPEGWGLIWVNEKGRATCVHSPMVEKRHENRPDLRPYMTWYEHKKNDFAERNILYSALRRLQYRGVLDAVYPQKDEQSTGEIEFPEPL